MVIWRIAQEGVMARLDRNWKAEAGDLALAAELHRVLEVSHRQAKGILDAGCVKVNGTEVRAHGHRLQAGDEVSVSLDPATEYHERARPRKDLTTALFTLLWEDKHLVFVDKPAGLLSVPTETSSEDPCLADALTEHYRARGFKRFKLYIVHRLDRFSSGVLVFAKTPEALHALKKLFEDHHLNRIYKAILVGELPENAGVLSDKLLEKSNLRMEVAAGKAKDSRFAKKALTHYRVLERLPGHTLVEVRLETGRRNQIRVQFADRGYPLLGDIVYGQPSELLDRQALHAELLGLKHPVTEEAISVTAPLPEDMESALKQLRNLQRVQRADVGVAGEEGLYQVKASKSRKTAQTFRARRFDPSTPESQEPRVQGSRSSEDRPSHRTGAPSRGPGAGPARPTRSARPEGSTRPGERPARPERPGGPSRGPGAGPARPARPGSGGPRRGPGAAKPKRFTKK
jgi:23S rRNA pseudouridine1911/1915/1917 synthase